MISPMCVDIKVNSNIEVNINIEQTDFFTPAAFILDQDDLFDMILEIRKCWFLDKQLIPYNKFNNWLKEPHYDFSLTPEVVDYWLAAKNNLLQDFSFTQITYDKPISEEMSQEIAYSNPMDLEIEYLLRKNGLTANYKEFILRAVVCGEVKLDDWEGTKRDKDFYHKDWWFNIPRYEKFYKSRPKDEIKRDRIWYWQFKQGKTDIDIARETSFRDHKIDPEDFKENYVKPALKRYKRFLKIKGRIKRI